jgi:DNA (cytosine-5)-methyltransferase 1
MMRHIDLCSGIGGFALGFEWAGLSTPAMFCDIEPWSRKILAKHWPDVPIEEDVKVLANEPEKIPAGGRDTILTAGYPCQPFSQAGKRLGAEDDRHIWPYIREIVAQKRPAWCVFENVYGHVSMGLDQVLSDLEADGYATRAFIVPACGVDAPHRRDRVWIIGRFMGNTESIGRDGRAETTGRTGQTHQQDEPRLEIWGEFGGSGEDVADTARVHAQGQHDRQGEGELGREGRWPTEPAVGRVAHGIPRRVDRLKGLGNAILPKIAMQIGIAIRQCEASATGQ